MDTLAEALSRIEPLARDGAAALTDTEAAPSVEDALRRLGERGNVAE
jgi:hypothetical protein